MQTSQYSLKKQSGIQFPNRHSFPNQRQYIPHNTFRQISPEFFPSCNEVSNRVKLMMEHVSKIFIQMLQNLKYLYQTNGINYRVDDYYNTLIRLLTPHQLLSHFHLIDNQYLFKGQQGHQNVVDCKYKEKCRKLQENHNDIDQIAFKRNGHTNSKLKMEEKNIQGNIHHQKYPNSQLQREQGQSQNNVHGISLKEKIQVYPSSTTKKQNGTSYKKQENGKDQKPLKKRILNSCRALLGKDMENQIAIWVAQELLKNNHLQMKHIAVKAKQFASKIKGFKSSIGWVNRFLARYPTLKRMIKQCRQGNKQGIKKSYMQIKRDFLNQPNIIHEPKIYAHRKSQSSSSEYQIQYSEETEKNNNILSDQNQNVGGRKKINSSNTQVFQQQSENQSQISQNDSQKSKQRMTSSKKNSKQQKYYYETNHNQNNSMIQQADQIQTNLDKSFKNFKEKTESKVKYEPQN